ncbi:MAG TPA: hypothetical protein VLL72_02130 [Kiloniellales bacterium]|nr:hypothetical protein [Kiloniellales bacterium]
MTRNIDPTTRLATDYLNHFNEIIMLLELVSDMPECFEDCLDWHPKSYQDHFRDSGFADREAAIRAYESAPARYRRPFDETVARMNETVSAGLAAVRAAIASGEPSGARREVEEILSRLRADVERTGAIIHGRIGVEGPNTVEPDETAAKGVLDQAAIDGLFND